MIKKVLILIFISQILLACGFTPTYKVLNNVKNVKVHYEIDSNNSYEARRTLNTLVQNVNRDKVKFITKVNIKENESAVNVNSSGSVNEYKIEVLINFEIFKIEDELSFYKSQSRGFANYDVSDSEYTNTLVKKDALERALTEGIQLMKIIVQSKFNE